MLNKKLLDIIALKYIKRKFQNMNYNYHDEIEEYLYLNEKLKDNKLYQKIIAFCSSCNVIENTKNGFIAYNYNTTEKYELIISIPKNIIIIEYTKNIDEKKSRTIIKFEKEKTIVEMSEEKKYKDDDNRLESMETENTREVFINDKLKYSLMSGVIFDFRKNRSGVLTNETIIDGRYAYTKEHSYGENDYIYGNHKAYYKCEIIDVKRFDSNLNDTAFTCDNVDEINSSNYDYISYSKRY